EIPRQPRSGFGQNGLIAALTPHRHPTSSGGPNELECVDPAVASLAVDTLYPDRDRQFRGSRVWGTAGMDHLLASALPVPAAVQRPLYVCVTLHARAQGRRWIGPVEWARAVRGKRCRTPRRSISRSRESPTGAARPLRSCEGGAGGGQ